jgi:hypothetical protein
MLSRLFLFYQNLAIFIAEANFMTDRLVSKVKDPFTLVLLGQIGQCDRIARERAIARSFKNS